jgi:uncharacterized cupredoxin-like copper-binding protein
MFKLQVVALAVPAIVLLLGACGDNAGDRRSIAITQRDDHCAPANFTATAGERLVLVIKNESKRDQEVEGIDGTKLEEALIPSGKTRNVNFTAPRDKSVARIKCYAPGGQSTIIEAAVAEGNGGASSDGTDSPKITDKSYATKKAPKETVAVTLQSFAVSPDRATVAKGAIRFAAKNVSPTDVHELAVLRVKADGTFENTGEIEDIEPGKSGEIVLDLPRGAYVLACVIVPGEAGSTEDHFQRGMHTNFTVE